MQEDGKMMRAKGIWRMLRNDGIKNVGLGKVCVKCGKSLDGLEPFYSKSRGSRNKNTVYYCEGCYRGLWM